jgi:8-oxo-dGTP diphosphatase
LGILGCTMKVPAGLFKLTKEILRHLLRRPVVGVSAVARTDDGRVLLVRRADTGKWALPGGTVEWGETLRATLPRELWEEAGVSEVEAGQLLGVYSSPDHDPRFHAITVLVAARIGAPKRVSQNPVEILEVQLFDVNQLPPELSHGNKEMLDRALAGEFVWE